jgi:putative peptide zinc metalloprotease protein
MTPTGRGHPGRTYLVETSNGRYVRLSATAYVVLTRIDAGATADEVARDLGHRLGRAVTAAHVQAAYARVRRQVDAVARQTSRPKPFGLWFRVRLLPLSVVDALSRQLSGAFHPAVAVPLALVIALAAVPTLAAGMSVHHSAMDPGGLFVPLLGLFMVSMFAHELGHASAGVRYGAPARDIGFGLYVIYPVFYSDVTAAWRLTRGRRVVIDLAGLFFQFLVGSVYLAIHRLTGWEVFYLAAASIFFIGLFVLLPIFKFDGYWLLTDLLGVVNLSRQVRPVAVHLLDRLRRRRATRLPWPPWVSVTVLVYGVFSAAYLCLFAFFLARTLPGVVATYPARVANLLGDLYAPPHTPAPGAWAGFFGATYVMVGIALAAVALGRRVIRTLKAGRRERPM